MCAKKGLMACRTAEKWHDCACLERKPELCRARSWHRCNCLKLGPGPCRGKPGYHDCTCVKFGWRSCRGKHPGTVEARRVRALVVASHGSAPNAEISSPILRGFAGLPHQLRLCVAEIAWVLAAADAKNDK